MSDSTAEPSIRSTLRQGRRILRNRATRLTSATWWTSGVGNLSRLVIRPPIGDPGDRAANPRQQGSDVRPLPVC